MAVFWSMILWTFFWGFIISWKRDRHQIVAVKGIDMSAFFAFFLVIEIAFFAGMRTAVADTHSYMKIFKESPTEISRMFDVLSYTEKDKGYVVLQILFKKYISENVNVFFTCIAIFQCWCIVKTLRRYSENYVLSILLYLLMVYFYWMFNGMRQFIVVVGVFACFDFMDNIRLTDKAKIVKYIISVLILSTIHNTGYIMILVYFIVQCKPWSKISFLLISTTVIILMFSQEFIGVLGTAIEDTAYGVAIEQFAEDDGVNPIRVIVALLPSMLCLWKRDYIEKIAPHYINICINMSLISAIVYAIGVVTSGIYMGRLPIYFELYNLILLPWYLQNAVKIKYRSIAYLFLILFYFAFYFYQMIIAWDGVGYVSSIIGINMRWMSNWLY